MRPNLPRAGLALAALWPILQPAAAIACPTGALQAAADLDAARAAHAAILAAGAACSGEQRDWAGRVAAAHHAEAAGALLEAGGRAEEALALLEAGLRLAPVWQGLLLRGDLRQQLPGPRGRPDYAAASADYQAALTLIQAGDPREEPVPEATIATIWRLAEQTRLIADRPVETPVTRAGEPAGLALPAVRSFKPRSVAYPIQFEFDSDTMTAGGQQAAELLERELAAKGRPPIRLIGHTDPIGQDAYNLGLSRRRAEAVRRFLVARGYAAARIRTEGRGKRQPYEAVNPESYTPEEINQMLRRVEMQAP